MRECSEGTAQVNNKKGRRRELEGSFTVEISLLMGLILALLVAILLTGFYLHDQACLQGAACELTAMAGNLQLYSDRSSRLARLRDQREKTVIWSKSVTGSCSAGKDEAVSSYQGSFRLPGMTAAFLNDGMASAGAKWKHNIYHPADIIWKAKGARALLDVLLE